MDLEKSEFNIPSNMKVAYAIFRLNAAYMFSFGFGDYTSFADKGAVRRAAKNGQLAEREAEIRLFIFAPFVLVHHGGVFSSNELCNSIRANESTSKYIGSISTTVTALFQDQRILGATFNQQLSVLTFSSDISLIICLQPSILDDLSSVIGILADHGIFGEKAFEIHEALREEVDDWDSDKESRISLQSMLDLTIDEISELKVEHNAIDLSEYEDIGSNDAAHKDDV